METTFQPSTKFSRADGLLILTTFIWGFNFSVLKFAMADIPPLLFNGLRFPIASLTMVGLALAMGHSLRFQRRHLLYLAGLGFLGNSIYQVFFILGLKYTTADNSSLILATVPAWVALFGTVIGLERVSWRGWMGVLLSLAGIILIILGSDRQVELRFGNATIYGDMLSLFATLCWAVYTLALRPLSRHYSSIAITSFITLSGSIPLVLMAVPLMPGFQWQTISLMTWLAILFSGMLSVGLAYFFWNYGVARLGSTKTSIYSNLVPPVTLFTAWLWLGETLMPQQWIGACLALGGVMLARRYTHPAA